MSWKDSPNQYGGISIALHWINAALVIALLIIGFLAWPLPRGPQRSALLTLHVSLALLLVPFAVARIAWRLRYGRPVTANSTPLLAAIAATVWRLLLIAIAVQLLTGPLLVWMHARPIQFFDWFEVPSPLPQMEDLHRTVVKPIHQVAAVVLSCTLAVHVLGALKHLLIEKDTVVRGMLTSRRLGRGRQEPPAK